METAVYSSLGLLFLTAVTMSGAHIASTKESQTRFGEALGFI